MKYIKTFENIADDEPKIGDYVLLNKYKKFRTDMTNFLSNNIGKIIFIDRNYCIIEYYNVPDSLKDRFEFNKINKTYKKTFKPKYISNWSRNITDIEAIINTKKYGL